MSCTHLADLKERKKECGERGRERERGGRDPVVIQNGNIEVTLVNSWLLHTLSSIVKHVHRENTCMYIYVTVPKHVTLVQSSPPSADIPSKY